MAWLGGWCHTGKTHRAGDLQGRQVSDCHRRPSYVQGQGVERGTVEVARSISVGVQVDGPSDQGKLSLTGHREWAGCEECQVGARSGQGSGKLELKVRGHGDGQWCRARQVAAWVEDVWLAVGIEIKGSGPVETIVFAGNLVQVELADDKGCGKTNVERGVKSSGDGHVTHLHGCVAGGARSAVIVGWNDSGDGQRARDLERGESVNMHRCIGHLQGHAVERGVTEVRVAIAVGVDRDRPSSDGELGTTGQREWAGGEEGAVGTVAGQRAGE